MGAVEVTAPAVADGQNSRGRHPRSVADLLVDRGIGLDGQPDAQTRAHMLPCVDARTSSQRACRVHRRLLGVTRSNPGSRDLKTLNRSTRLHRREAISREPNNGRSACRPVRAVRSSDWGKKADKRTENFKNADGSGSLYPLYIGRELPDGGFRAPDVTWFSDANGVDWIRGVEDRDNTPNWREGISTSTTCGRMGYLGKFYFLLPKGTPVDASLDVGHTPEDDDEGHYSIRCRSLMAGCLRRGTEQSCASSSGQGC